MEDLEVLKSIGIVKRYKEDEYVFKEGETGAELFIILSGKVEVFANSFGSMPVKITEMGPGDFFGEMSVLEDQPRSASIVAVMDTILLSISKSNFEVFISKRPSMACKIMKALSSRIRSLNDEIGKLKVHIRKMNFHDNQVIEETIDKETNAHSNCESKTENAIPVKLQNSLFHPCHKTYGNVVLECNNEVLYDKEIKCPICGKLFMAKMFRTSKMKLDRIENDFRRRYVDFEPLWYSIWTCPQCYYSSFYYDFESVNKRFAKEILEKTGKLKNKIMLGFDNHRNINNVFTAYYLALYSASIYNDDPLKTGKLWLQLSWLYNDVNDEEMFKLASKKALKCYYDAYYNASLNITTEEEQQCCLILGELFLLKEDVKEAVKHYHKAINRKTGSAALNQKAQDRILDIRSMSHHP